MATKTSAVNGQTMKSSISGVLVAKVDPDVMRAVAEDLGDVEGFDLPTNGATGEQVLAASLALYQRLYDDMEAANKKKGALEVIELVECDVCEGEAPESCERCPYCGAGGSIVDVAPTPVATQDDGSAAKAGGKTKKGKAAKAAKEAPAEEVAPKETSMALAKATKADAEIVPIHGGKLTAKTLDKYVAQAKELYNSSAHSYLAFGRKLGEIKEKGLFKLRLDENGKAKYASWDAFVHHEIGISPDRSYSLMREAEHFTEEDVDMLGTKKMTLILQAPPAARQALKEDAKKNKTTKKELAAKVKEVRKKAGYTGDTVQAQSGAKGGKSKAKKTAAAKPKITVAAIEGKKTIKLFAKPATMRNLDLSALKRAQSIKHVPFGIIELTNEVNLYITVQPDKNGELTLSYEARRITAE